MKHESGSKTTKSTGELSHEKHTLLGSLGVDVQSAEAPSPGEIWRRNFEVNHPESS
jgi:hypothetical protein